MDIRCSSCRFYSDGENGPICHEIKDQPIHINVDWLEIFEMIHLCYISPNNETYNKLEKELEDLKSAIDNGDYIATDELDFEKLGDILRG